MHIIFKCFHTPEYNQWEHGQNVELPNFVTDRLSRTCNNDRTKSGTGNNI